MARLVQVLNEEYMKDHKLDSNNIYSKLMPLNVPITVDDVMVVCDAIMKNEHALEMVMEINVENNVHLTHGIHEPPSREEYQKFMNKYKLFSKDELKKALTLTHAEVTDQMSKMVPCVGCRRSAESAYLHATQNGYRAYYPFQTTTDGSLYMAHNMIDFKSLFALFMDPSEGMRSLLASFNKFSTFKKGKRCNIHSLDSQRGRSIDSWMDVWDYMTPVCRKEIGTIKRTFFAETLEGYLHKHRFCTDCKATVLRAYGILTEVIGRATEPGFIVELFEGIDYDLRTDEIYVPYDTESIGSLISRAVPELSGSNQRERHAKTMETAQEEILTCLGVCIFERLHRIQQRFREEERGWEIVMCVAIQALRQSYELALQDKSGMASLQWLLEQEKQEEAKKRKKVLKKQRRKEKKQAEGQLEAADPDEEDELNIDENQTSEINYESSADTEPTVVEVSTKVAKHGGKATKGQDNKKATAGHGQNSKCSSENQDCGYASGNNNNRSETSTPLGSDTACSEGFCSHENSCGLKQVAETATTGSPVPIKPEPVKVEQDVISKVEPPPKASKKKPRGPMLFSTISFREEIPMELFDPMPYLTLEEHLHENELADEPIPLGDRELHHLSDPRVARKRRKIRAALLERYNDWRKTFEDDDFIPIEPLECSMSTVSFKPVAPAAPEPSKGKKSTLAEVGEKENKKPKGAGGGGARNTKAQQVSALRRYKGKNRR